MAGMLALHLTRIVATPIRGFLSQSPGRASSSTRLAASLTRRPPPRERRRARPKYSYIQCVCLYVDTRLLSKYLLTRQGCSDDFAASCVAIFQAGGKFSPQARREFEAEAKARLEREARDALEASQRTFDEESPPHRRSEKVSKRHRIIRQRRLRVIFV